MIQKARGVFEIKVLDKDRRVIKSFTQSNLILDQGLDMVCADRTWQACFTHCAAGTGSSAPSAAQIGLDAEVDRTGTYVTGASNCGYSLNGNELTLFRTFDFDPVGGSTTYRELGCSYTASAGNNLFNRVNPDEPIVLSAGQALRAKFSLIITLEPYALSPATFSISDWPVAPASTTDGDERLQAVGLEGIDENGAAVNIDIEPVLEPSVALNCNLWISPEASAPGTPFSGSYPDRSTNAATAAVGLETYTPGSFVRVKSAAFAIDEANRTDLRSMGLGDSSSNEEAGNGTAFVCVFDEEQTKDNLHSLSLRFQIGVDRA